MLTRLTAASLTHTQRHIASLLLLAAVSCGDDTGSQPANPDQPGLAVSALQRVADCSEAEALVRADALARMNARIDKQRASTQMLRSPGCPSSPGPIDYASRGAQAGAAPSSTPVPAEDAADSDGASEQASSTSTTNNQVQGVDEADFIKNDAEFVYAAINDTLRIIDAWPAAEAHEVANVKLPGAAKKLFVTSDRALVYVSIPRQPIATAQGSAKPALVYASTSECSYGYDCQFSGDGTATAVLVFDISDRSAPVLVRRLDLTGSLLAARRIGDAVHTIVVTPEVVFPGVTYSVPLPAGCGQLLAGAELEQAYEALRERNAKVIAETPLTNFVPQVHEQGTEYADGTCGSVYRETNPTGTAFTSLVSLDMVHDGDPQLATIVSKPGAVYASDRALYMAVIRDNATTTTRDFSSVIHKFRVGSKAEASAYLASGTVKGHVLNQFSLDEHAGQLRVATTFGKVPNPDVHSTLSVLTQREHVLELVGNVDDIAPGEDIRSVRFDGERAFIVTFKKTDPLYVFDLATPTAPRIAGELKIPGFSTYMHMLDATHLLTIGYDAADQGNFAFFTGVLLQIFDVSDASDPKLAHKTVIGTRGSSSEALTNHLAFNFWKGKLAVPMTVCEGGNTSGGYGTNMTFSGLIVYDVSVDNGLVERGRVAHPGTTGMYNNSACRNWWTNANSAVERSIFMDNFVYSVARDIIRVQDLDALGSDVASVRLTP